MQLVQTVEAVPAAYLPALHQVQEAELVRAVKPENLPSAQLMQTEEPAIYVHTSVAGESAAKAKVPEEVLLTRGSKAKNL